MDDLEKMSDRGHQTHKHIEGVLNRHDDDLNPLLPVREQILILANLLMGVCFWENADGIRHSTTETADFNADFMRQYEVGAAQAKAAIDDNLERTREAIAAGRPQRPERADDYHVTRAAGTVSLKLKRARREAKQADDHLWRQYQQFAALLNPVLTDSEDIVEALGMVFILLCKSRDLDPVFELDWAELRRYQLSARKPEDYDRLFLFD